MTDENESIEEMVNGHSSNLNGGEMEKSAENERVSEYFAQPQVPRLEAIIYAEFDNNIGRVVKYQVPREIFDKQHFESISSAVIPTEEMRDRMIKINMFDWRIIGFPVGIKDKRYPREIYIFNMCFILAKGAQFDAVYEPLVQKCAEYLVELEKECGFLSNNTRQLPDLMEQIYYGLNTRGECMYTVTNLATIFLKLCPTFQSEEEPPKVNPFLVPIFKCIPSPTTFDNLNRMDVLSQKICPHIDGVRCIKEIASLVQVDPDLVGRCIRNLCYHGCTTLLPLFLYSNQYVTTEKIRHFFQSPAIVKQCLEFVRRFTDRPEFPQLSDVSRLYLNLKRGWTLADWAIRMQPHQLNIDERKLVQFGIFYGFVRKLNIYPIAMNREEQTRIEALCDGDQALEDLAQHYSCSSIELHRRLQDSGNFRFVLR